ncbi:MAG: GntR family transcriptional regulator [Tannerella sp.]|jgi:DNA-binding GntR family transcriptional regulator|nr:GntR family transcriptional regulator [Tannerella sp.]
MGELAKYKRIYEALREGIADGTYAQGDVLPSESSLCERYGVAHLTVRKAVGMLSKDGLIVCRQGRRSVVKGAPRGIGILSIIGTTSALSREGLSTRIICRPEWREWSEAFSFPLEEYEREAGCIYFERVRMIDGAPVFFDITMLPDINLPRFAECELEDRSLFDTLRVRYGIVVTGGTQQFFAIRADRRMQDYLMVNAGNPVLQLNRRIDTSRAGFRIYSRLFCVTQKYGLVGTF